jgi:hypothetical protein
MSNLGLDRGRVCRVPPHGYALGIKLYRGDPKAFLDVAMKGLEQTDANWQGETLVESLRLLLPASNELPGLKEGLAELERMVQ